MIFRYQHSIKSKRKYFDLSLVHATFLHRSHANRSDTSSNLASKLFAITEEEEKSIIQTTYRKDLQALFSTSSRAW